MRLPLAALCLAFLAATVGGGARAELAVVLEREAPQGGFYAAGSRSALRIVIANRGSEAVSDIALSLGGSGVSLRPGGQTDWRNEDGRLHALVPRLAAGGRLVLEAEAEIVGAGDPSLAAAGGEAVLEGATGGGERFTAATRWHVDGCAARFHRALQSVRARHDGAIGDALARASKPEPGVGTGFVFDLPAGARADRAALNAAARALRARLADSEMRSADMKWLTGRLSKDVAAYLGQPAAGSLCTGAPRWTGIMRRQARYLVDRVAAKEAVVRRLRPDAARAVAAAREKLAIAPEPADTALSADRRLADLFLESGHGIGAGGDGVFATAKAVLASPAPGWDEEARDGVTMAAALLERLSVLERQQARSGGVLAALDGTLEAVRAAHSAHCGCR